MVTFCKERKPLKKGIDFDNARTRRNNEGIAIRKNRRMEGLQKRRSIRPTKISTSASTSASASASSSNLIDTAMDKQDETESKSQMNLPQFLLDLDLTSATNTSVSDPVIQLLTRNTTSIENKNISNNYVHCIKPVNNAHPTKSLKELVVESGIVPLLVTNLRSDRIEIREQSALCLGNIAGEMPILRDYVIQSAAISPILENITSPPTIDDAFLEKIVWSLSNMCRGRPTSEMNNIIPVFPVLIELVRSFTSSSSQNYKNSEILLNACWALTYLTEDNESVVQVLIEQRLALTCVTLLKHESSKIVHVALRILGNFIVSGYMNEIIEACNLIGNQTKAENSNQNAELKYNIMDYTSSIFTTPTYKDDKNLRNETFYFLSLIAGNGTEYIDILLMNTSSSSEHQLKILCQIMQTSTLNERMDATWVIFNIAKNGTDAQLAALIEFGAIPALCYNLTVPDIKFTLLVLNSIENFLLVGDRLALDYRALLEECGGSEKMEQLLNAENDDVYRKTNSILEEFFEKDNDSNSAFMDELDEDSWYY